MICFFFERYKLYCFVFFFSSRRRHTRLTCDWSSDVCSSDLQVFHIAATHGVDATRILGRRVAREREQVAHDLRIGLAVEAVALDRARGARLVEQRALNRPPARAVGPEQGAVDVEEDELHAGKIDGQLREV